MGSPRKSTCSEQHFPWKSYPWDQYKSAKIVDLYIILDRPHRNGQNLPKQTIIAGFSPENALSEQCLWRSPRSQAPYSSWIDWNISWCFFFLNMPDLSVCCFFFQKKPCLVFISFYLFISFLFFLFSFTFNFKKIKTFCNDQARLP